MDIHVELADYKYMLMKEASELGTPIIRPLLLHFSHDEKARQEDSQFMLGENILMAPVFGADEFGEDKRNVYLPGPAKWTYLWLETNYEVG